MKSSRICKRRYFSHGNCTTYEKYMTPLILSPCQPVKGEKTKSSQPRHWDLLRAFKRRARTSPANVADFYLADTLHADADLTLRYN
jgi:hypothetical protein